MAHALEGKRDPVEVLYFQNARRRSLIPEAPGAGPDVPDRLRTS
jgi:hypothetical protein